MIRKSIIIVDDELLIRDLLYDFFSERNWTVSVCESGEKSMEIFKNKQFDLALVDIKMAEMDGLSFIRKLKALYPLLPIVVMTGFPSVETAVEALRLKVDDYFIKPFNINKLYKTIENLAEQNQKKSEMARLGAAPLESA
jgi:DNA-binding response OmpR family regulator